MIDELKSLNKEVKEKQIILEGYCLSLRSGCAFVEGLPFLPMQNVSTLRQEKRGVKVGQTLVDQQVVNVLRQ